MTTEPSLAALLDCLDGSGSDAEWAAIEKLRALLGSSLPIYLVEKYKNSKDWRVRSSCVFHATRYARSSPAAIELGLQGIKDRAKVVRYRACILLAYSLKKELIDALRAASATADKDAQADLLAVIDAIEHQNHNYFVDRDHSGNVTLNVH